MKAAQVRPILYGVMFAMVAIDWAYIGCALFFCLMDYIEAES